MARVFLIAESESERRGATAEVGDELARLGMEVTVAPADGSHLTALSAHRPDAVVLDRAVPGPDTVEDCRRIRQAFRVPLLFLSERGGDRDIVTTLHAGADDYVVRPVTARVLQARIDAVVRRSGESWPTDGRTERHGRISIDRLTSKVALDDVPVLLTRAERKLLFAMSAEPGRVFSRGELLRDVWALAETEQTQRVEACVKRLRLKLEGPQREGPQLEGPQLEGSQLERPQLAGSHESGGVIQTVRGLGYRFNALR
ncbi:response regulator transcription factor [Streptomyces sp. NPDC090106]|uniref:response regulator transcription factor n=1 Tax=Streptomyces sp. NPDC090106 TaxID=3365946 RepID=UPI00381AB1C4